MRIALYERFSTEMQSDESIEDQRRTCRDYIKRNGWREVAEYHDAAISGGKGEKHRPGYAALLQAARNREIDAIVVEDISRLWRSLAEQSRAAEELKYLNVSIIGINCGTDTRREGAEIAMAVSGVMNDRYRKEIGKRTHRGLTGLALEGKSCGGKVYGYRTVYETTQENGRPVSRAVGREIVEEEAQIIRQIFKQYADGQSPRAIAAELNRLGIPAPGATWKRKERRADAKWLATAIHGSPDKGTGILNNELYAGRYIWNRSQFVENPSSKKRERRERPESEWIKQDVPELRIVPPELWQAVKERQEASRLPAKTPRTAGRGPKYLFSGLLKCAECGQNFVIWGPDYYGCGSYTNGGGHACSNRHRVKRELVEHRLLEGIKKDLLSPEAIELFRQETARLLGEARRAAKPDNAGHQRRLAQVQKEIENVLTAIRAGIVTASTKEELERLEAERTRLQAATEQDTKQPDKIVRLLPGVVDGYRRMVGDLAGVARRDIDRARAAVRNLLGGEVRLVAEKYGLVAELRGDYVGMLKLAAAGKNCLENNKIYNVVAGAGFEPTTFGL